MTSISYVISYVCCKKKYFASSVNYGSNNVTKLKILKRLKETNQTKSFVALLDLLINQVFFSVDDSISCFIFLYNISEI